MDESTHHVRTLRWQKCGTEQGRKKTRLLAAELVKLNPRGRKVWIIKRWPGNSSLKSWTSLEGRVPTEGTARSKGRAGYLEENQRPGDECVN